MLGSYYGVLHPKKMVGVVVDVPDVVAVWDGPCVERSVLTTWVPTVVILGHAV
jgi:hypothetical protein